MGGAKNEAEQQCGKHGCTLTPSELWGWQRNELAIINNAVSRLGKESCKIICADNHPSNKAVS